jgi:hypothetical protein
MKCSRLSLETADDIPSKEPHSGLYHNVVTTADEALQDREPHSSLDPALVYAKLWFIPTFSRHL